MTLGETLEDLRVPLRRTVVLDRPLSCADLVRAMYAAGQDRREVKRRVRAMGRWSESALASALWTAECEMGLQFEHGSRWREAAE